MEREKIYRLSCQPSTVARYTITVDQVRQQRPFCAIITKKDGRHYVIAKAAQWGEKGKIFALVVDNNNNPVTVTRVEEAISLGCGKAKILKRNVKKVKIGSRELRELGFPVLARKAIKRQAKGTKQKKGVMGFFPAKLVGKLVAH